MINIKEIFKGLQNQMEAKLTFNRKEIGHSPSKGAATELEWIEMLSKYLPKRYCAESAFVVDSNGNLSEQIDIVIFDRQYSPFILKQNGVTYIPAESVYAVIEVKQDLSKKNITYAQKKAASVRKLHRTSAAIPYAGGVYPPKPLPHILAGIVAVDGKISTAERVALSNASGDMVLNFGCSLMGKTCFNFSELHPYNKNNKPHKMQCQIDENSLVSFFMILLAELQKMGTVPAIDIGAYLKDNDGFRN